MSYRELMAVAFFSHEQHCDKLTQPNVRFYFADSDAGHIERGYNGATQLRLDN